jgi:hypothetical protein
MERYQVKTDKDSGLLNDPNAWCEEHQEPRYIIDLVKRVVRVSVETARIVKTRLSSELRSEVNSGQWTVDSAEFPRRWRALLLLPRGSEGVG